jgi:hypothetical protein
MALCSHVVEAAGVRSSERRRAWADSSKRASVPDAEPRTSEITVADALLPTGPVSLTRRLRRGLWLCSLKTPGLRSRLRPPFYGDVTFYFYTVTAPPRPAPPRPAPPRAAPPRAAAPAQRRLRLACAAPPAPSLRSAACA